MAGASNSKTRFKDILRVELGLFRRSPLLAGAAFLLILIPSFYTGTYVCSIWDPYSHLDRLPAGLTTLDTGVKLPDKTVNLGADLVKKLEAERTFGFLKLASEGESEAAVRSGRVYFALVIPADFSTRALSGTEAGRLKVYVSGGRSYVGKDIAEHAVARIARSLDAAIAAQEWSVVLAGTAKSRQAAARLSDGAAKSLAGAEQLDQGLAKADNGAEQLAVGQKQLADGIGGINTEQLVSAGAELHDNTAKLAEGLERLPAVNIVIGVPRKDLTKLADGARQYQDKIVELASGIDKASAGAGELARKSEELSTGMKQLHDGSRALAGGIQEINNGLNEFISAIPTKRQDAQSLAEPVAYETIDLVPVSANGPAFTPYFMGLSMWIGVLTVSFLFRLRVLPRHVSGAGRVAALIGKWICPLAIAAIAALTLGLFVHVILGVPIHDKLGYYAVLLAAAFTFGAIVFALNSLLGDAGKLLALVLLIIQISVVGGAYPIAVEPPLYRAVSPWLPMTSIVFGLRAAMFGSFDGDWLRYILIILPWLVAGLMLGLIAAGKFSYVDDEHYGPAMDIAFGKDRR